MIDRRILSWNCDSPCDMIIDICAQMQEYGTIPNHSTKHEPKHEDVFFQFVLLSMRLDSIKSCLPTSLIQYSGKSTVCYLCWY